MCIDFELLKVKVPLKFLGTAGFSLRRDGRYILHSTAMSEIGVLLLKHLKNN